MKRLSKIDIGQILLTFLMFSVIVDPTNTIFGVKEIAFGLVLLSVAFHKFKVYRDAFIIIGVAFFILLLSSITGHLRGYDFDKTTEFGFYKSFLFLFVLLLVKNKHYNFIKASTLWVISISLSVIVIYCIASFNFSMFPKLYDYFNSHDAFVIVSPRNYLGYNVLAVFYKSSPILVLFLSYVYSAFWNTHKIRYLLCSLFFCAALLLSGTRANMVSSLLIMIIIPVWLKIKNKVFIICAVLCCVFIAAKILLSDKKETSLKLKNETLYCSIEHLKKNKDILILGQGCGSLFYSSKERPKCGNTELTYIELIRMFGIVGALILIVIFILPIILIFRLKPEYYFSFVVGYTAYLFIGATNPLLISSTGFTTLAIAYSFAFGNSKLNLK